MNGRARRRRRRCDRPFRLLRLFFLLLEGSFRQPAAAKGSRWNHLSICCNGQTEKHRNNFTGWTLFPKQPTDRSNQRADGQTDKQPRETQKVRTN